MKTIINTSKLSLSVIALISLFPAWTYAGNATVDLTKGDNKVEFLAVGRPGALKIHGETKPRSATVTPLNGILKFENGAVTGTATYALDNLDTGINLRTEHMKEKYLEVGKYPTSSLKLTKLTLPDGFSASSFSKKDIPFEGDLSLHGVTKPIKGTVAADKSGDKLKMQFEYPVALTDFGIMVPEYMGITVAKDVTASVSLDTSLIATAGQKK